MKCAICKIEKDEFNFHWRNKSKGVRQRHCKECASKFKKRCYEKKHTHYRRIANERKQRIRMENRRKLIEYLNERKCVDCNESDPIVLDFDHLYNKKYTISKLLHQCEDWNIILTEIKKCVVRCANCHRRKTAKEQGWTKWGYGLRG